MAALPVCRIRNRHGVVATYTDLGDAWAEIARGAARLDVLFVAVVGSRRRNTMRDYQAILNAVVHTDYGRRIVLVSGGASKGADDFAEEISREHHIPMVTFPAQWDDLTHPEARVVTRDDGSQFDATAGHRRNEYIARCADLIIALPHITRQGGTEGTIRWGKTLGREIALL